MVVMAFARASFSLPVNGGSFGSGSRRVGCISGWNGDVGGGGGGVRGPVVGLELDGGRGSAGTGNQPVGPSSRFVWVRPVSVSGWIRAVSESPVSAVGGRQSVRSLLKSVVSFLTRMLLRMVPSIVWTDVHSASGSSRTSFLRRSVEWSIVR